MKTAILCGGRGTRLGKHGESIPKGLIEIGGYPILWHILKLYKYQGLNDFILCLGYLGEEIKKHFQQENLANEFNITFVDTGLETNTGGRIKRIENYIEKGEDFCVTYGDGLADVDLKSLIEFHRTNDSIGTLTAIHPQSPFGLIKLNEENSVIEFQEKPKLNEWINGGFFVFKTEIFDYLEENSILERKPLEKLAEENQLKAFQHKGFWKCMDTYKDNLEFNELWEENKAIWKIW